MNIAIRNTAMTIPRYLLTLACLALLSCTTSPEGRKQLQLIPDDQMDIMGAQSFEQIKQQTPITKDQNIQQYISCIANKIIPQVAQNPDPKQWEVLVFEDEQANAFALPGYKIGVYTGLLKYAKNQDQVAAVMGHEVAHVIAKHGNERVSNQMATEAGLSIATGNPRWHTGRKQYADPCRFRARCTIWHHTAVQPQPRIGS